MPTVWNRAEDQTMLSGVTATDPLTYAGVAIRLALAARIDPLKDLRHE